MPRQDPLSLSNGTEVATTLTDTSGEYEFGNVPPGDYNVTTENDPDYPDDVSDEDSTPDGDPLDTDTAVDNSIPVTVAPGEDDGGNDFVDTDKGSIQGNVANDLGQPLEDVVLTLIFPNSSVVTTTTGPDGSYEFVSLPPGEYTVIETNPPGYPADFSDFDVSPDGDPGDSNTTVDNIIDVVVDPGEDDTGNNFVDVFVATAPPAVMTEFPSMAPSLTPVMPTLAPVSPTLPPSKFCEEIASDSCPLCAPYRNLDYCKPEESFPALIQNRTAEFRNDPVGVAGLGYWFQILEDKVAAYLLSVVQNVPAPQIFCCVTDVFDLTGCISNNVTFPVDGVVIKATNFHSNQGVFVLGNFTQDAVSSSSEPYLVDMINGIPISFADVLSGLSFLQATKIIVEEFIGSNLPTEYKFHVVNGTVAAVDIIDGRGTDCPCYGVVDTEWNRLDDYGCFEPGGFEHVEADTQCVSIDFITGKRKAGPVKKDLYLCDDIPYLDNCTWNEMNQIALELGNTIGVYMRVDMFVVGGNFYVQEYTTNHMNGLRHCAAVKGEDGCVDSCFLGRLWNDAGQPFGGAPTDTPDILENYGSLTAQQQCDLLSNVTAPSFTSQC